MRWTVHSERDLYRDQWVHVATADVELPDGRHLDHRIIRTAAPGAAIVVVNDDRVLLMWRHRFITDTYGWEIPHGSIRPGEKPAGHRGAVMTGMPRSTGAMRARTPAGDRDHG